MEEQEGVNPGESPTPEDQNVVEDVNQSTEESSTQEPTQLDEGETQELDPEIYDPTGVPWKNRAAERERKLADLAERLPNLIEEKINELKPAQKQEQQYTIEQLEAFAEANPEHRAWANREIRKLEREELRNELRNELSSTKKEQQDAIVKAKSEDTVLKTFPQMFLKDASGNVVGWNTTDPMTVKVAEYMRDPVYANNPRGIELASKQAYADLALAGQLTVQKNNKQLKKQVRKLEQQTLPEGNSQNAPPSPSQLDLVKERLAKTGSISDAKEFLRHAFAAKKWIKE